MVRVTPGQRARLRAGTGAAVASWLDGERPARRGGGRASRPGFGGGLMCGIAGAVAFTKPLNADRLKPMVDAISHRGPDDSGFLVWQSGKRSPRHTSYGVPFNEQRFQRVSPLLPSIDTSAGLERLGEDHWDLFLGHRRLAVIDLSPRGHQPMTNKDRSLWVVYNGELYNYKELRRELETLGFAFESHSDTEVLIHAYDAWGEACVDRFNGMFAFAIWDVRQRRLWLVRDRYGVKPLYYYPAPRSEERRVG